MKKAALLWLGQDLRADDNPALRAALCDAGNSDGTAVHIVTTGPAVRRWLGRDFEPSVLRQAFIRECVAALKERLTAFDICWHQIREDDAQALSSLVGELGVKTLYRNFHPATEEVNILDTLKKKFPALDCRIYPGLQLARESDLPFAVASLPATFSAFRRKVENITWREPLDPPTAASALYPVFPRHESGRPAGGEHAARTHLSDYFAGDAAQRYKDTRNALGGWRETTRFSCWLARGCLSPLQVLQALRHHEAEQGASEQTYWIYFELLWREFFHWVAYRYGDHLFAFRGLKSEPPRTAYDPETFERWCQGETGYDIVDACMRQLLRTGHMSNRGRQLVASCLVHELQQDWRLGAAWFEQQLIDYDPASNWGNWQYLAGVGCDPRGHRRFNLEKQAQHYDPEGDFRRRWLNVHAA